MRSLISVIAVLLLIVSVCFAGIGGDSGNIGQWLEVSEGISAALLKTGQDTQYGSQKDDGYYQMGERRSYTSLTTGQYSGTTSITISADTIAMENGCVIDNNTGLMWMKYTPDSDIGPGGDGKLYWDNGDDWDIFEFCDQANAEELAGHDDWRVPNVFELFSLIVEDAGIGAPYIDTAYFQCVATYYWSSTTYPYNTPTALYVFFGNGRVHYSTKSTGLCYVRLVRGG